MDLIAVGDVMVDVHVQAPALKRGGDVHGRVRLQPAGTSANAAVWAAWDGATARVLGRVGDDMAGGCSATRSWSVTWMPRCRRQRRTVRNHARRRRAGERSMVADRGANAELTSDDRRRRSTRAPFSSPATCSSRSPPRPPGWPRSTARRRCSSRWRRRHGPSSRCSALSGSWRRRRMPVRRAPGQRARGRDPDGCVEHGSRPSPR